MVFLLFNFFLDIVKTLRLKNAGLAHAKRCSAARTQFEPDPVLKLNLIFLVLS
jgi:hypothetical protein